MKSCRWWINLACAFRDGLVKGPKPTQRYGPQETAMLPLMTGREIFGEHHGYVKYELFGSLNEMQLHLQCMVGKTIGIIRGCQLMSQLSPEAGVRYDGL